ncbi:septum formation initiator family protein [Blastococcus sp. CCUG 61487]|uniref:FtsB family cell division protein n=1 Tax=Blastococcus sp. CCUG 61487 TaxID=1840703 RepID=UPI0010C086BB|nr:septum formation initiator family protein [Blastococcus sp. CCUG 61487]TKJ18793.1 septum formation inhibitor [Blastococcus sp. CCUG 61487]
MSSVRGRRGGAPPPGSRSTGRAPRVHTTRPVRTRLRSGTPNPTRRPGERRAPRRQTRPVTSPAVRRRPLFTGKAALLMTLVLLLALTLAGPIRQYLEGRQELAELTAEGAALDRRAAELERQLDRQADPAWIERQARERLTYVLPGDRLLVVVDGAAVEGDAGTLDEAARPAPAQPWYEGLMESLARADGDLPEEPAE